MKTQDQKNRSIGWKTMMIKSKAANKILRYFNKKDDFFKLPEKEKIEAIEKITKAAYWELRFYKDKRKEKAAIEKLRTERGHKSKKKTSKTEYEQMKKSKEVYPENWYMNKD